jgi:hypothetical protein
MPLSCYSAGCPVFFLTAHAHGTDMDEAEYLKRLGFEHELIERRIGWLLTSQSILLTAYALALDKPGSADLFRLWVPRVGLLLALAVLCGVIAAALAKYHTWRDFQKKELSAQWGVRTYVTVIGLIPDFTLPVIFACVWLVLIWKSGGWVGLPV